MLRMTWKVYACPKRMCRPGINGEGELRGQPANPGSPGEMAVKTECVCVCVYVCATNIQTVWCTATKSGTVTQSTTRTGTFASMLKCGIISACISL